MREAHMTFPETAQPDRRAALIARIANILAKPESEWRLIEQEKATVASLYTGYIALLAAVPALSHLIGSLVFGIGAFGFVYHPSFSSALSHALATYVLTLAGCFI